MRAHYAGQQGDITLVAETEEEYLNYIALRGGNLIHNDGRRLF